MTQFTLTLDGDIDAVQTLIDRLAALAREDETVQIATTAVRVVDPHKLSIAEIGLPVRILECLTAVGFVNASQLTNLETSDLRSVVGITASDARVVLDTVKQLGISRRRQDHELEQLLSGSDLSHN